jgi:UDP-glucose 4-epimerase
VTGRTSPTDRYPADVRKAGKGGQAVTHYFVTGGCGFIGSHVVHRLLELPDTRVTAFDNLCSGHEWYLDDVRDDERLEVVIGDLKDLDAVVKATRGCDHAYHLAANPDIAKAETEPSVDFWEGTYLTNNLIEACRVNGVKRITYASGSGIYGDRGTVPVNEDFGPLYPVSTYGASKLGCEAMLSAYCHMFEMHAVVFRFANVVGPRQTHGVTYDFVRRLLENPAELLIFGDGQQSKSYIHVSDVLDAALLASARRRRSFELYNVATGDYITVTEIARLAAQCAGVDPDAVRYEYAGGDRGWKGDIPVVRLNIDRIKSLGWEPALSSHEALRAAMTAMLEDSRRGLG